MTPDKDLSARLLPCPFCGMRLEYAAPVTYVHPIGKCILSGRNFKKGVIGQWGKRVLADHQRAVQAAVAKAVEAERAACADVAVNRHWHWSKLGNACLVDDDASACADIAVAIRARKGDAL